MERAARARLCGAAACGSGRCGWIGSTPSCGSPHSECAAWRIWAAERGAAPALDANTQLEAILGVDESAATLWRAGRRLGLSYRPASSLPRVYLVQCSVDRLPSALSRCDVITLVEVIEHLPLRQLRRVFRLLFQKIRPRRVIVTTPNVEFNVRLGYPPGELRHPDHRFEWTRAEFAGWCAGARRLGYVVEEGGIGPADPRLGPPP